MTNYQWALVIGAAFSVTVATSALMVAHEKTQGWLVGIAAQTCLLIFAVVTRTWTLLFGPAIVGPVFVYGWRKWRAQNRRSDGDQLSTQEVRQPQMLEEDQR